MKKTVARLLAIAFALAFVLSAAPLCFAAGATVSGSEYGISTDPPAGFNPPSLPAGYTPLDTWPNESNTGIQDGYTKDTLPHTMYGPARPDTVTFTQGAPVNDGNNSIPDDGTLWTTSCLPYGQTVITTDGTVIKDTRIEGGLSIQARNVVIKDCYIEANDGTNAGQYVNGHGVIAVAPGATVSVINCEINGLSGIHAGIWYSGDSLVAVGNNIYNCNDGIFHWANNNEGQTDLWGNNFRIQDNWIHDNVETTSNGHTDGWQTTSCSNGLIQNNYFDGNPSTSGNIALYGGVTDSKYIMFVGNLFQGCGFPVYCYSQTSPGTTTGMWFIDNAFSTKYSVLCGQHGAWYNQGDPNDGWFNDPATWKSFRLNNYFWDPATKTSTGSADPKQSQIPPGAWACAGDGATFQNGLHELGSNNVGLVATEFKIVPLMKNANSGLGYTASGASAGAWPQLSVIFKLNVNGYFSLYNGPYGGYPLDSVPANTPDDQLPALVMRYKVGVAYQVRMVMDTNTQTYSAWVTELDANGNPTMAPFCVGENYGFRGSAGVMSDIGRIFTSPGNKDAYYVTDHKLFTSVLESSSAAASVEKLEGETNKLTITVTETYRYSDGQRETKDTTETFEISNNAAGTYAVGGHNVYVDTKGNIQIRECYIID